MYKRCPARVMGCFRNGMITIVLCPDIGLADGGRPEEIPMSMVPVDLRMPNSEFDILLDTISRCFIRVLRQDEVCHNSNVMSKLTSTDFRFLTDKEALEYLQNIVEDMVQLFSVKSEDCIECINQAWSHEPMVGLDLVYRESPDYWAKHFMYGKNSYWWVPNREECGHKPLEPLPYWLDKVPYNNLESNGIFYHH
jgi:hypothetical protein